MSTAFFLNSLPSRTAQLVHFFQQKRPNFLQSFYLSGGTGLSLQLGHRESEDLDFFSQRVFQPQIVEKELSVLGTLSQTELSKGTLNTFFNEVKLQFLEYQYPLLEPLVEWEGMNISSIPDIACTKLNGEHERKQERFHRYLFSS
ncbi:nucleotidyl transferase AbiEii/AbiGii toxin family protein [Patescibacteria group bacterium]|nr:nucleotidyl transferase AbiEii/AbiGii toxin family protein [Patescibacteria group bacterium]MBU1472676.1 nucleotidyl transferase AbiEii/AbiGii toxin family protein [Patescibacteria group bacterium]